MAHELMGEAEIRPALVQLRIAAMYNAIAAVTEWMAKGQFERNEIRLMEYKDAQAMRTRTNQMLDAARVQALKAGYQQWELMPFEEKTYNEALKLLVVDATL